MAAFLATTASLRGAHLWSYLQYVDGYSYVHSTRFGFKHYTSHSNLPFFIFGPFCNFLWFLIAKLNVNLWLTNKKKLQIRRQKSWTLRPAAKVRQSEISGVKGLESSNSILGKPVTLTFFDGMMGRRNIRPHWPFIQYIQAMHSLINRELILPLLFIRVFTHRSATYFQKYLLTLPSCLHNFSDHALLYSHVFAHPHVFALLQF